MAIDELPQVGGIDLAVSKRQQNRIFNTSRSGIILQNQ
jgi:hypothetical protein